MISGAGDGMMVQVDEFDPLCYLPLCLFTPGLSFLHKAAYFVSRLPFNDTSKHSIQTFFDFGCFLFFV